MNLAFHYHVPAIQKEDGIYLPGYLGLFIDSIAPRVTWLICFMHEPLEHELAQMDYRLQSKNIRFKSLGIHSGIPSRTLKAIKSSETMFHSEIPIDVFLVRGSTPLLPFVYRHYKRRVALLLVSDAVEGLDNLNQPFWRLLLIKLWARTYRFAERRIAARVLTVVNSDKLFKALEGRVKQLVLTKTTTLRRSDIFGREDTCQNKRIEILYAGRITKVKGILDILDALGKLKERGTDFRFHLVGMVDKGDDIIEQSYHKAKALGIGEQVLYHGYKSAGDELLAYYRQADIYVIGSQGSSEGFPRTIWEAMASGTPVVATAVSSIPGYIGHCAEIVPPNSPPAIAEALLRIIENGEKRRENIRLGKELAATNTLEARGEDLIRELTKYHQDIG